MVEQTAEAPSCPRVQGGESLLQKKLPLFESRCFSLVEALLEPRPQLSGRAVPGWVSRCERVQGRSQGARGVSVALSV